MFDLLRNITKPAEEKRQERLNAYLDGALSAKEQRRFEQELQQDDALRADLEQLRWVKLSVEQLPRVRAPRNFILDPAVHGQRTRSQPVYSFYPGLRVATALTAFFFILALALDLATPYGAVSEPLLGSGASQIALEETSRQADDVAMATEADVASQPPEEEASDGESAVEMAPFAITEEGEVAAAADEAASEIVEEEALVAEEATSEDAPGERTAEQPAAEEPAMPQVGGGLEDMTEQQASEATATAEADTEAAALAPQTTPTAESTSAPPAMVTETAPVEEPASETLDESERPFPYLLLLEIALGAALAALVVVMFVLRRGAG